MRTPLSILLLLLLLHHLMMPALIFTRFKAQQEFIATNLCVERAVEDNHCQGACHLKAELKDYSLNTDFTSEPAENQVPPFSVYIFQENELKALRPDIAVSYICRVFHQCSQHGVLPALLDELSPPPEC